MNNEKIKTFRKSLRVIEREIEKQLKIETSCCGVTLTQCHVLMELDLIGESSLIDLSNILDLDKSTLSRVIDGMVNIDLLKREIDTDDRRYMKITLTENGKKAANNINLLCDKYYNSLFNNIPEEKHRIIIESIELLGSSMKDIKKENTLNQNFCNNSQLEGN